MTRSPLVTARILALIGMFVQARPAELTGDAPIQRGNSTGTSACRTYATADTMALSSSTGVSVKATKTCDYRTASNELACTIKYSDNRSVAYTTVMTVRFASVADFVGDAPRIALFGTSEMHPMTAITNVDTLGVRSTTTSTYSYDAQRRPTRLTSRSDAGSAIHTFTSWDMFGRPTAATTESSRLVYTYNDNDRTATITNVTLGTVVTETFDVDGIHVRQTSRSPASSETSTWTIHSTAQVCR